LEQNKSDKFKKEISAAFARNIGWLENEKQLHYVQQNCAIKEERITRGLQEITVQGRVLLTWAHEDDYAFYLRFILHAIKPDNVCRFADGVMKAGDTISIDMRSIREIIW
jgi:hypothetical protein